MTGPKTMIDAVRKMVAGKSQPGAIEFLRQHAEGLQEAVEQTETLLDEHSAAQQTAAGLAALHGEDAPDLSDEHRRLQKKSDGLAIALEATNAVIADMEDRLRQSTWAKLDAQAADERQRLGEIVTEEASNVIRSLAILAKVGEAVELPMMEVESGADGGFALVLRGLPVEFGRVWRLAFTAASELDTSELSRLHHEALAAGHEDFSPGAIRIGVDDIATAMAGEEVPS